MEPRKCIRSLNKMDPRNFLNYLLSLAIIIVILVFTPRAYDVFALAAAFVIASRLAEWFMTRTRRYVLPKTVSCNKRAVFITGCDSGFGHLVAKRLDKLGYHVFAACLFPTGPGAQNLAENCTSKLTVVPLDVTSDKSVDSALDFVKSNLGNNELWAVVNNAGVSQAGEMDWTPFEDIQRVIDVNTFGMVRVTKAFLPLIRKSQGRVVNNTSLCANLTCPGYVGYCMSKSASQAFTIGLRVEMAKWNVKAISIEPFFYKTPITDKTACLQTVENTWNKAPQEVRDAYGTQYIEAFKQTCVNVLKRCSPKIHEVVYCFEDAVTAEEPLSIYFPCYFPDKILYKLFMALPRILMELYQLYLMPYHVTPAALLKHKEKCYINGVSNGSASKESNGLSEQLVENCTRKEL